jgi:hypothetical protein
MASCHKTFASVASCAISRSVITTLPSPHSTDAFADHEALAGRPTSRAIATLTNYLTLSTSLWLKEQLHRAWRSCPKCAQLTFVFQARLCQAPSKSRVDFHRLICRRKACFTLVCPFLPSHSGHMMSSRLPVMEDVSRTDKSDPTVQTAWDTQAAAQSI